MATDAPQLIGTYKPPKCRVGDVVECLLRGKVTIVSFRGPLHWPIATKKGNVHEGAVSWLISKTLLNDIHCMTSVDVSKKYGMALSVVTKIRQKFGVTRLSNASWIRNAAKRRKIRDESHIALLGTKPDKTIARQLRIPATTVRSERIRRRIPACRSMLCGNIDCGKPVCFRGNGRPTLYCSHKCKKAHRRSVYLIRMRAAARGLLMSDMELLSGAIANAK